MKSNQFISNPNLMHVSNPRAGQIVFLRRNAVEKITGLSRSGIYAQMAAGQFPRNVAISSKSVRWVESEVVSWCEKKIQHRR